MKERSRIKTDKIKLNKLFVLFFHEFDQEPRNQGFRAVVVSPSRELAQQTYREFVRLADGRGFRIHTIDNTAKATKKFGPQSAGKFGKGHKTKLVKVNNLDL